MEACRPWALRLSAWFDGECSDMDAAEVRAHLLACPGCRATASRWGALREELALLEAPEPDGGTLQRMAVRFERGLAREVHDLSRALRVWRLAAGLLLAVGGGALAAERLFLPGQVQARVLRDMDQEWNELLKRPNLMAPTLLRPEQRVAPPRLLPAGNGQEPHEPPSQQ